MLLLYCASSLSSCIFATCCDGNVSNISISSILCYVLCETFRRLNYRWFKVLWWWRSSIISSIQLRLCNNAMNAFSLFPSNNFNFSPATFPIKFDLSNWNSCFISFPNANLSSLMWIMLSNVRTYLLALLAFFYSFHVMKNLTVCLSFPLLSNGSEWISRSPLFKLTTSNNN